jgi:AcrR family transcriptional regulator
LRADAQKNRQQLINATIELVLEVGGEPARDAIADRAGVGIGTLYRHFPDHQSLLHAVVRHALEQTIAAGESLLETVPDGADALRQYMHVAIDNGIGVVNIIHPLLQRREWPDLLARAAALMRALVDRAAGKVSPGRELSERDIVFALIRFSRPLAIGLPRDQELSFAHRHLDFYIDGLCAGDAAKVNERNKYPCA